MNRIVCIYHANCADGFTAAWCVRMFLGPDIKFIPASYGDAPPAVEGADVIIVDFSYKRDVLAAMADIAQSVLVLDHHKTAQADLTGLKSPSRGGWHDHVKNTRGGGRGRSPYALFDMGRSGAQMAWDFFGDGPRPALVEYVADRDLWKWELGKSREVSAAIRSHDMTWITWNVLANSLADVREFDRVANEGAAILRAETKMVRSIIKTSRRLMVIGGHTVPVAAAPYDLASDTAGTMAEGALFAATYVDGPKGRGFSLRSRDPVGVDVSEIAKIYGGGGHRNAAGFSMPIGWEGDA